MRTRYSQAALTLLFVLLTGLPASPQLRPQVTQKPKKTPAAMPTQIVVETSPNAQIYLDDAFKGQASPQGRLVIDNPKPGDHTLRVSLAGKKDYERQVRVVGGQLAKVQAALADLAGSIRVLTFAGAEVLLDNSSRGTTDQSGQLVMPDAAGAPTSYAFRRVARRTIGRV